MSPEEQKDLHAMKVRNVAADTGCMVMCREYLSMTEEQLKHAGHRADASHPGLEQIREKAITSAVRSALKDKERNTQIFLKKWPDK